MESGGNPAVGLIALWMLMQLVTFMALLLGGIYALFCLGRAAAGLDRLASAVEDLVERQNNMQGGVTGGGPNPLNPAHRPPAAAPMQPQPFGPSVPATPPPAASPFGASPLGPSPSSPSNPATPGEPNATPGSTSNIDRGSIDERRF